MEHFITGLAIAIIALGIIILPGMVSEYIRQYRLNKREIEVQTHAKRPDLAEMARYTYVNDRGRKATLKLFVVWGVAILLSLLVVIFS